MIKILILKKVVISNINIKFLIFHIIIFNFIELVIEKKKNKQMQDEFNVQRAKYREIYLKKEEELNEVKKELDDLKSQLLVAKCRNENELEIRDKKAQEEIASLQQLVQGILVFNFYFIPTSLNVFILIFFFKIETIDESSIIKQEFERIQEEIQQLKIENRNLRDELNAAQQV